MKDDTYKGIVDRLVPINNELENNKKTKYKIFYNVSSIRRDPDDACLTDIVQVSHSVDIFLSKTDVEYLNEKLDEYGCIHHLIENTVKKSQGLQMIVTIKQIFQKHFETTKLNVEIDEDDCKDGEIIYHNSVRDRQPLQ